MKVFVLSCTKSDCGKKILGLTPEARLYYQIRAAGVAAVTRLKRNGSGGGPTVPGVETVEQPAGPESGIVQIATALASREGGPVAVFDSDFVFQRDFAAAAIAAEPAAYTVGAQTAAVVCGPSGNPPVVSADGRISTFGTRQEIRQTKKMLLDGLRKPMLVDGIVGYYIMRPITLRITSMIANTPITPNQVTAFCMILGLAGSAMVAFAGAAFWMVPVGAFLYFAGATLDCVDGEMARLKYAGSYSGAWFDTISDDITTTAMLVAMGWYQTGRTESNLWLYLGVGGALAFVIGEIYVYYYLAKVYHSGDVLDFQWASGRKKKPNAENFSDYVSLMAKRDFFSFTLMLLALGGVIEWGLVWLSGMMYVFIVYVLVDIVVSLRRPGWRTGSSD